MKKFLFPLLTGMLLLSACTTPVSKLETVEQQGLGGYDSAWEAEQHGYGEDPYAKYYQEGVPIFSELQTQVLKATQIFGDPESREDMGDFSMGISGIFRTSTAMDENGQPIVVNDSMSIGGEPEGEGTYVVEFGCWGVGLATLQVFINTDFSDPNVSPSSEIPLNCGVPAKTTEGVFDIDRPSQDYNIVISGEPQTIGSYEVNVYRRNEG